MKFGAHFITDDRIPVALAHEGLIGRMASAALRIDDPRISEAHALLSCRGDSLKLLALRGRLSAGGKPRTEVTLRPGLRVVLAGFFGLTVTELVIPPTVATVVPLDGPAHGLAALGVISVFPDAPHPLRPGYQSDAAAWLWSTETSHTLRIDGADHPLAPQTPFTIGGRSFHIAPLPLAALNTSPTAERGPLATRLSLTLLFDAVHITPANGRTVTLDGLAARTICELFAIGVPVSWSVIALDLWPDPTLLEPARRQRWDQLLSRIRARLREAGLRSDLVRSSGQGLVELALAPHDTVEDLT